jgi:hypothetical protein
VAGPGLTLGALDPWNSSWESVTGFASVGLGLFFRKKRKEERPQALRLSGSIGSVPDLVCDHTKMTVNLQAGFCFQWERQ